MQVMEMFQERVTVWKGLRAQLDHLQQPDQRLREGRPVLRDPDLSVS